MSDSSMWVDCEGDFALNTAVVQVMPEGVRIISAEAWGQSAWTKTARISAILPDGREESYFLKAATGKTRQCLTWGQYHSATDICAVVSDLFVRPIGKGEYHDKAGAHVCFFLMIYYDMDLQSPPDPLQFTSKIAEFHRKGTSPNGMFGYHATTGGSVIGFTNPWQKTWAAAFTIQLQTIINLDNEVNAPWPAYDAACKQVIDHVIPRLLGALESDGRKIKPTLVHTDLWEGNVGTDRQTGKIILFDASCVYAHNELEFGTWRCSWATHFCNSFYIKLYQLEIEPSEPKEEWDDRNRLYAARAALLDGAGHPGSKSRMRAYNDMLYLCEKYAPLETLEKYDPERDISATGIAGPYDIMDGLRTV